MSSPWRIEFGGALYHVLSTVDERGDLFLDDEDRNDFISLMGEISRLRTRKSLSNQDCSRIMNLKSS